MCLSDFIDPKSYRPFSAASVSSSSFSSRSYHPVSSFAAVVALGWHRSARSNLISSCKFNYWLTAPRHRALYLLLASPRASRYSCFGQVLILFLSSFLPLSRAAPRTNPSRRTHCFCLLRLRFLGQTLRTRLLVNGKMRDPGSTYVNIRFKWVHQPPRVFNFASVTKKAMCSLACKLESQSKNYILSRESGL